MKTITELLKDNCYPGRGVLIGTTPSGKTAIGYFIMGRSENSRNRVFIEDGQDVVIHPFDASKVSDPSLIIYSPIRVYGDALIVTNGDQTDTVYDALKESGSFESALDTREFEPDAPNFTPRISGIAFKDGSYKLNILKCVDGKGEACARYTFTYPALKGEGRIIHTYEHDGNPLPTFAGEPRSVAIADDIDAFTKEIWDVLNEDNRISLYTRFIDNETGEIESRMINKHVK